MRVIPGNRADWALWTSRAPGILWKALLRLWGRDVMLYVGGVSFFAMLAVFPAVAILIGLYSLVTTPEQATFQAELISRLMPSGAESLFEGELHRLVTTPPQIVSLQSAFALVVGGYASHRGFKALLAGLSFIHDDEVPRGFFSFNFLALVVLVAAFMLSAIVTAAFVAIRVWTTAQGWSPLRGANFLVSEWTWTSVGLTVGLSLVYRFAMSSRPVIWTGALIGGVSAAMLFLFMSLLSAFYVERVIQLGATYGSIATVVVLLIWLSWNVNAIFFGGALATEIEIAMERRPARERRGRPRPAVPQ